jgi:catechol 2,3-dioxygenase-like lactoylglutathione lyase family enzyme
MADGETLRTGQIEAGIVVADLEAMTSFYGDVLGLEHVNDDTGPGRILRRFMRGGGAVKLLAFDEPPAVANPPNGMMGATGLRYLTIEVDDVQKAVERCAAAGRNVPVAPFEFAPGQMVAVVEDPEGNWVELAQRT